MIRRSDTVEAIRTFVRVNPQLAGGLVVPLGESRDSGAIQGYFASDLPREVAGVGSLDDLYSAKNRKVIFIDDFTATGNQVIDILAAGLANQSLRVDLGENRQAFDPEIQAHLRMCKVGFVFSAAWNTGLNAIQDKAPELGLDAVVYGHLKENDLPFAFEGDTFAGMDNSIVADFRSRCAAIGETLALQSSSVRPGLSAQERAAQRALGYGNRGLLLATPVNVPSQTLTAIWASGKVDGVDWRPLLRRRKKI
jgi:hypothetical protein